MRSVLRSALPSERARDRIVWGPGDRCGRTGAETEPGRSRDGAGTEPGRSRAGAGPEPGRSRGCNGPRFVRRHGVAVLRIADGTRRGSEHAGMRAPDGARQTVWRQGRIQVAKRAEGNGWILRGLATDKLLSVAIQVVKNNDARILNRRSASTTQIFSLAHGRGKGHETLEEPRSHALRCSKL